MKKSKKKIIISIISTILVALIIITYINASKYFGGDPITMSDTTYEFETKEISCSNNGKTIYGVAYIPKDAGEKIPTVIFSHGYNGTYKSNMLVAKSLAMSGIASYSFDFRGGSKNSKSDGKMTEMSVFTEQSDLNTVIDKIKTLDFVDTDNLYLFGESQGGFVSAITANERPDDIKGLMLLYPALVIPDGARKQFKSKDEIPETIKSMGGTIGKIYNESILDYDVYNHIAGYKKDVLIFHGDTDKLVNLSYSQRAVKIYNSAKLEVFKGERHGFTEDGKIEVAKMAYKFILDHSK
jgi:alpha-beta hydrolase superfamily lysophospholipase